MLRPLIAIFGGSFDPIHQGHLQLAEIVSKHINPVEIYFVPCGHPVHRPPSLTATKDRLDMLKSAIKDHPHWHLDTYEVARPNPSYTLETLKYFKQKFPNNPLGFIMGMDTFASLETWGNWKDLFHYTKLIVAPREGWKNENILHEDKDNIMMLPVAPPFVSSTAIRNKLAAQEDVSSLIPKAVYDIIKQRKLYL